MPKKTLKAAINTLANVLNRKEELLASIQTELKQLEETQQKIEEFVGSCEDIKLTEVPEIVAEKAPFVAWLATEVTDGSTIQAHMQLDDVLIPEIENQRKAMKAKWEEQLKVLEGHMLARLESNGTSSTSVAGIGRAEKRLETKYSVPDKALFAKWAIDNGAASELTISLRPNSKFMAKVLEENGELPQGVSMTRTYKCVMVKA